MKLPYDLLSETYTKPRLFLCEPDKTIIGQLDTYNLNGKFKFNGLSEITFSVDRTYEDFFDSEPKTNPLFDKIEAIKLVLLEGFGYFVLQGPKLSSDGIQESKQVTAYSLEYTLSQKFLQDFIVNTGETGSIEVTYSETYNTNIQPVTLYNPDNTGLSLLHLIIQQCYGWSIGHVDAQIAKMGRTFEIDRESIYDFLTNELCEKFNCHIIFDTVKSVINIYANTVITKLVGDGKTKQFIIYPPFSEINNVAVDGYKTLLWDYNAITGALSFDDPPESGVIIEVEDGSLQPWETDVLISFDNLSDSMDISYDADNIKTVLYVDYGDGQNIREINMGLPYITDLSYFYNVEWMGQDLYDAYTKYSYKINRAKPTYIQNSQKLLDYARYVDYNNNRLSIHYGVATVNSTTAGEYYIRGGNAPDYYYTKVTLPSDYNANTIYYKMNLSNLAEKKVSNLYNVLKDYFTAETHTELETKWRQDYTELTEDFLFVSEDFAKLYQTLISVTSGRVSSPKIESAIKEFLKILWNELGKTPLQNLYYEAYKQIQVTNIEMGWSENNNPEYPNYYPVVLFLDSIEKAITERKIAIQVYQKLYERVLKDNAEITNDIALSNNFTENQLLMLNAFLREDKVSFSDIVQTDTDTVAETFKLQEHAFELARIELQKISAPKLEFSTTMGNIYAMSEFEPIVKQFQLGNIIKIKLRQGYLKQARLLQVDINFEDFTDFSCQFGELTQIKSQSDIHADLLAGAITAGKQVANNATNWTKSSEKINYLEKGLQQGLLDTVESLKSAATNQTSYMDKYGLHLESVDPETGEVSDKKVWLVNDKIVFTDDNFKTSKSVIGEYTINNTTRWGLIAECVNAGLIEGCQMIGGTIQIGKQSDGTYAFEVKSDGTVVMNGGGIIEGFVTEKVLNNTTKELQNDINNTRQGLQTQIDQFNSKSFYRVEIVPNGSTTISTVEDATQLNCHVYLWDTEVTDTFDKTLFMWERTSNYADKDVVWNSMPEHQNVKQITITADDVIENSSFVCIVNLPE